MDKKYLNKAISYRKNYFKKNSSFEGSSVFNLTLEECDYFYSKGVCVSPGKIYIHKGIWSDRIEDRGILYFPELVS